MRTDSETLRELISGFSVGTDTCPAEPTSDGLAVRRLCSPLDYRLPGTLAPGPQDPYLHSLYETFECRSSSTIYGIESLEVEALLGMVRDALVDDVRTWGTEAATRPLELFVLLLRLGGTEPGIYRVRLDGVDLVRPLSPAEGIEGTAVQKEFARAGAIVSVAANLDEADVWGGAAGYYFTMSRSATLIYLLHLRAAARGLVGTVFAGFVTSAVRHLLDSDGVSRHQIFAVTIANPQIELPGQAAGQSRLARREHHRPTCWFTAGQTDPELHAVLQSPADYPVRGVGARSRQTGPPGPEWALLLPTRHLREGGERRMTDSSIDLTLVDSDFGAEELPGGNALGYALSSASASCPASAAPASCPASAVSASCPACAASASMTSC